MSELAILPLVPEADRETAEVLDVLRRFVEMAEKGELVEVLIVGIQRDTTALVMGASGQVGCTQQVGALERFKAHLLAIDNRDG